MRDTTEDRVNRAALVLSLWLLAGLGVLQADEFKEPKFLLTWGKKGDQPGEFHSPIGLAINQRDELFVTDVNNARVQKFSSEGQRLGDFDLPLDKPPRKSAQSGGIALDEQGRIYVSFMSQHKVAVYAGDGKLLREWGRLGKGDGEFNQPGGILLAADGTLYVTDQCNHRVQQFTTEGKFLAKWGGHGSQPGQFDGTIPSGSRFGGPHTLAQDSRGRLYTTEGMLGRVQQLTPAGQPLAVWGDKGEQPGGFGAHQTGYAKHTFGPIAVMVDRHDRVWVSSLNDRVQCFTTDGKFLFGISRSGSEPGQLARPHGMVMDSKGNLYVADAGNQRIQKFAVPAP